MPADPAPTLLLLPGDGIGPEVMAEVRKVIAWFGTQGLPFTVEEDLVGGAAYDAHGTPLTDATMENLVSLGVTIPSDPGSHEPEDRDDQ